MSGDQAAKRVRRVQSGVVNGMSGGLLLLLTGANGLAAEVNQFHTTRTGSKSVSYNNPTFHILLSPHCIVAPRSLL